MFAEPLADREMRMPDQDALHRSVRQVFHRQGAVARTEQVGRYRKHLFAIVPVQVDIQFLVDQAQPHIEAAGQAIHAFDRIFQV